jgi:16S rRNA G1207 methylase RsmC
VKYDKAPSDAMEPTDMILDRWRQQQQQQQQQQYDTYCQASQPVRHIMSAGSPEQAYHSIARTLRNYAWMKQRLQQKAIRQLYNYRKTPRNTVHFLLVRHAHVKRLLILSDRKSDAGNHRFQAHDTSC